MKLAVTGFFLFVILLLSGGVIYTVETRSVHQNELDSALGTAMEQTMEILTVNPVYQIKKDEAAQELAADFIQNFLIQTTSDSEFEIEVLTADADKGLLDVRVTERYRQIIGEGKAVCKKTVILEDEKVKENQYFTVSFQIEGKTVKQAAVRGGDYLSEAVLPESGIQKEGYVLAGWERILQEDTDRILYDSGNISTVKMTQNVEFKAVYRIKKEKKE